MDDAGAKASGERRVQLPEKKNGDCMSWGRRQRAVRQTDLRSGGIASDPGGALQDRISLLDATQEEA